MAFAAVVSFVATTKRIMLIAKASATSSTPRFHPRRVAGTTASAAMPERNEATCQPVSAVALIATPPVEKRSAAPRSRSRSAARFDPAVLLDASGTVGRWVRAREGEGTGRRGISANLLDGAL